MTPMPASPASPQLASILVAVLSDARTTAPEMKQP
jgi:hypothetical protein